MNSLASLVSTTFLAALSLMACEPSGTNNEPLSPDASTMCTDDDTCPWSSSVTVDCSLANPLILNEAGPDPALLREVLDSLAYDRVGPYSNEVLPLTDTFGLSSTIDALDLSLPEGVDSERTQIAFRIGGQEAAYDAAVGGWSATEIPGVTCTKPDSYNPQWCEIVEFDDANVRFRGLIIDTHPNEYNFVAVIDILPGCASSCESEEQTLLCPSGACWQSMEQYCRLCWGKTAEVCACATEEGFSENDTTCEYALSGDISATGTCQSGTCVTDF